MTYQEILEGITRHRANILANNKYMEMKRKIDEIEWALQAIAEKLRDSEQIMTATKPPPAPAPTTTKSAFQ